MCYVLFFFLIIAYCQALKNFFIYFASFDLDIDSSRKLREEFAKSCFETLLQFSFLESGIEIDDDGVVNLLAVTSLLHRFKEVIHKYAEDERLSGKCPLPRYETEYFLV